MVLIILPFAYFRLKKMVKKLVRFWAESAFWVLGKRIRIYGAENYSNAKRYIIIANHASLFDIMAIMSFCPDVSWVGHERLMKIPVFSRILRMIEYIPVKVPSVSNTRQMLEDITGKIKRNSIAIFPEGTRTLDGTMNSFFRGFIFILRVSDADILPVTLNGFYSLKPKNRFHINFSAKISAVIHKPLNSATLKARTDEEITEVMRKILEAGNL